MSSDDGGSTRISAVFRGLVGMKVAVDVRKGSGGLVDLSRRPALPIV
jgi:hypothetical protein